MIDALEKNLGVITAACKAVGISRQTHYDWLKSDPEYKQAVDHIGEAAIDFVESKLFELIKGVKIPETKVFCVEGQIVTHDMVKQYAPDTTATIFYLKTKAKKRGYIERTEQTIDIPQLKPVVISVEGE